MMNRNLSLTLHSFPERDGTGGGGLAAPSLSALIVDDEVHAGDPLVRLLALEGFRVECASTGHDGIESALSRTPDAILLDLHLPDILGLTVLSELRRAGVHAPVILVTGWYLDAGHDRAAHALGAGFMRKPLDATEVAANIVEAIRGNEAAVNSNGQRCSISNFVDPSAGHPHSRGLAPTDTLRTLHEQAIAGETSALELIMARELGALRLALERRFHRASREWIDEAVVDALMEYRVRPDRFDPTRGVTLHGYLLWAARCNLQNILKRERRRSAREITASSPERFEQPRPAQVDRVSREDAARVLAQTTADFNPVERQCLRLWLDGERRTEVYAAAAGFSALPVREKRLLTKQLKDRILRRLRRHGRASAPGGGKLAAEAVALRRSPRNMRVRARRHSYVAPARRECRIAGRFGNRSLRQSH